MYKLATTESKITFDFPTLYSKIPHSKLLKVLCDMNSSFLDWGKKFAAKWVSKSDSNFVVIDKCSFKKTTKYV